MYFDTIFAVCKDNVMNIHKTSIIGHNVKIGNNVKIGAYSIIFDNVSIGDNVQIGSNCMIGYPQKGEFEIGSGSQIGNNSIIRSHTIIYENVACAERFETGHRVTIRENTVFGLNNRIGTVSDIQGDCSFGDYVRLHSNVHIGKTSKIGNYVWIFPYVVLTNDPYPPSNTLLGVTVHDFSVIATGSVLLPGTTVNTDCLIGAMSLVKGEIPSESIFVGNPGKVIGNISKIKDINGQNVYPWRLNFDRGMPWQDIGYDKWFSENFG